MLDRSKSIYSMTISADVRYPLIMKILSNAKSPLSSSQIAQLYIINPGTSDALVTGTILNVLSLAGIVKKHITFKGRAKRIKYELVNK